MQFFLVVITAQIFWQEGCLPGMPHSTMSFSMSYLNELSSLHFSRNTRRMHHGRLGDFRFDVVPSSVNWRNMYTSRSWRDDECFEEGTHVLEDLLAARWMYQVYEGISKRNTCIEPSRNTKTIEDSITLCHVEENKNHTKSMSITQKHRKFTWTPQLTHTCPQCHVELCYELS